jgi:uncharacterized membrane protein YvbJ
MWICNKCGSRTEQSLVRCFACNAPRRKPQRIKSKDLEEALTLEQIAEWERVVRRRKRIAWLTLAFFAILAILLYLFVFSEYMGWPRPDGLINIGPSAKGAFSLGLRALYLAS